MVEPKLKSWQPNQPTLKVDMTYNGQSSTTRTIQYHELPMLGKFLDHLNGRLDSQNIPLNKHIISFKMFCN